MSKIIVRAYNVGFGDAILVTIPDKNQRTGKETIRSILIDVGNLAAGAGSGHTVFEKVIKDIKRILGDRNVDLYIMTHEHYDHVTGLYDAFNRYHLSVGIDYAWLTASSADGYYRRRQAALRRKKLLEAHYRGIKRHLSATEESGIKRFFALMANNDPIQTQRRVRFLKKMAVKRTTYVHADKRLKTGVHHPFEEAQLSVLAPEEDTACYPIGLQPLPLTVGTSPITQMKKTHSNIPPLKPPVGVDPKGFARLLELRKRGFATDILAIDKAANNTSIVFMLEWRGWRLLFTGDAEEASWIMMERNDEKRKKLKPVHFLKVGHHGSINGTPNDTILKLVLPTKPPDSRKRIALVSTCPGSIYGPVPHGPTLKRIGRNSVRIRSTTEVDRGDAVEEIFEG